jgi:sRNA-binding carbon storage regulator CsrA
MLEISRRELETVVIGHVFVTVLEIRVDGVRLGIKDTATGSYREEVLFLDAESADADMESGVHCEVAMSPN